MIKAVIPALLIATMAAGPASAGFYNGNDLAEQCRRKSKLLTLGYVVGIVDTLETIVPEKMCIPGQVTAGQLVDILCKYVEDNPNKRHHSGELIALASLNEAFPCQ